jgi:DNA-binding response OmpR family regulator
MGEERKAEHLDSATRQYEEALKDFGIYKDIDKQAKLEVLEKHIIAVLERIFQKRPFIVRYKDILAEYHSDKEKASIMKGALRLTLNKRAFLIFQYLVEHMGECVTKADLHQYWIKHEEGYASKECIRTYINRDIRGKLGLQLSRDDCPKKTGWILSP